MAVIRVPVLWCRSLYGSRIGFPRFGEQYLSPASIWNGFSHGLVSVSMSSCGHDTHVDLRVANDVHHGSCGALVRCRCVGIVTVTRVVDLTRFSDALLFLGFVDAFCVWSLIIALLFSPNAWCLHGAFLGRACAP